MKRLLPLPLLSVTLVVLWLLLANDLSFGQLLLGILLGLAVPLYTSRFWPETVRVRRPLVLVRFTLIVLYDILVANVTVARLIIGRQDTLKPAFVVMPLELRTDMAISLLANTISLTPGTVSAHLSADRRCLIVHSLHTTNSAELLETMHERYEKPLKEILETC